ncbi:EndoU domain-containing protein [Formosimonas limnophila]|uniref:EndoU domain-containing protein n=1 Tax=Formosimonas limnophila TaxID=1384487 RepID=UPI0016751EF9|nr:EndoU domain-containing protein [Formosimonas limnophila]
MLPDLVDGQPQPNLPIDRSYDSVAGPLTEIGIDLAMASVGSRVRDTEGSAVSGTVDSTGYGGRAVSGTVNGETRVVGSYLDDFKPSPTPARLVEEQASQPTQVAYINYDHIINGNINGAGNGSGGHYIRSPNIRVTEVTGAVDSNGVTKGYIQVRDPNTGGWANKTAETTFYPETWTQRQVQQEIQGAFLNSKPIGDGKWQGTAPSGVTIQGYYGRPNGTGTTAWPVWGGKK